MERRAPEPALAYSSISQSPVELPKAASGRRPITCAQNEVSLWEKIGPDADDTRFDTARHPRWKRPYTELTYKPMQEVLQYLRANAFKTYIVTGGGQDFVRVYAERVYGIPPEQIVGTVGGTKYDYGKDGKPVLIKEAKLLLNDNYGGKPEGIHLMIGRQPLAAFGNSTGDREMLEYAKAGAGARLSILLLHDDAAREYAYGPAQGLPESRVGTFTQQLYDEAKSSGWTVISMKNDWKRIFAFE